MSELALLENAFLEIRGITVICRSEDGYVNATALCRVGGTRYIDWRRSAQQYLEALARKLESSIEYPQNLGPLPHTKYIIKYVNHGNTNRATWVHPIAAIDIARYIDPDLAVQFNTWIFELYTFNTVTRGKERPISEIEAAHIKKIEQLERMNELLKIKTSQLRQINESLEVNVDALDEVNDTLNKELAEKDAHIATLVEEKYNIQEDAVLTNKTVGIYEVEGNPRECYLIEALTHRYGAELRALESRVKIREVQTFDFAEDKINVTELCKKIYQNNRKFKMNGNFIRLKGDDTAEDICNELQDALENLWENGR